MPQGDNYGLEGLFHPEVHHLSQIIKKHGQGARFFSDESIMVELKHNFNDLRRRFRQPKGIEIDSVTLEECLQPFISLLQANDISGTILGAVLGSLAKFLREERFGGKAQRSFRALALAVAKFRFEGGDVSNDEGALQRLLDVLLLVMKNPLSETLGDVDICLIVEACLSLCVLPRTSELFKRQAELACIELFAVILGKIEEKSMADSHGTTPLRIAYPGTRADDPEPLPPALAALEAELEKVEAKERQKQGDSSHIVKSSSSASSILSRKDLGKISCPISEVEITPPYTLSAIVGVLNHILRLLEVGEKRNTDRLRSLCLVILTDFIELHSKRILEIDHLWNLVSTKLTKILIQLLNQESSSLMTHLHQIILSVFSRFRRRLIAPFELFLSSVITLLNQRSPPGKSLRISKEFYLEILLYFCLDPMFLCDLYVFYECGERFAYVLSDLIGALAMTAMIDPRQGNQDDSYYLALELIISILKTFSGLEMNSPSETSFFDPENLAKGRQMKFLMIQSADLFNTDPKEAFAFLVEHKLISSALKPQEIAKYLRRTVGLDKKAVGELISKPSNIDILKEYLADFHFSGLEIDEALRSVLESFRLPGEAQQISRIMEVFAQIFYRDANQPEVFRNEDAVFILAYSIVMLNTDQHNRQVRHRMTLEDFIRNNRGINDGQDFGENFLKRIYFAIREKEIVMPEEQGADAAFNFVWNEQLKKYKGSDIEPVVLTLDTYAKEILEIAWRPFLSCFRALILSPRTDFTSKLAVKGIAELGIIADRYLESERMDEIIIILAESMSFAEISINPAGNQLPRYLARSELFKCLFKCFCDQFRSHAGKMRNGWAIFVNHLLLLFQASVVSLATFEVESVDRKSPVSPTKSVNESGIFFALSQYLTSSSPTDSSGIDAESKNKAVEFVKTCKLDEIIRDSRFLEETFLQSLIQAMIDQLKIGKSQSWETDTLVFLAELIVHTAWNNRDRMGVFWNPLFAKFSEIAKDLSSPAILREHCILGVGRLSLRFAERPEMQREVVQFFQLLCYVPPDAFQNLAEPALSIVLRIVELDPPILHGTAIWPHYFTVLALSGRSRSTGPYSFGLLTTIVREDQILFPLEFYSEYVDLLNGFVASASSTSPSTSMSPRFSGDVIPSPVELASQALQKFVLLELNIRKLVEERKIKSESLWNDFVIPVHCAIAQQCYHPIRDLRNLALSLLQRTILSIDFSKQTISALFEEFKLVLIPLLEELQRPELRKLDGNVEEIRVRSAAVLSKVFLANMPLLFADQTFRNESELLWMSLISNILRFLDGRSDVLRESIPETIKNMLLVMASSKILRPPMPGESISLWDQTWALLDPIMPRARAEILEISAPRRPLEPISPNRSPSQDEPSNRQRSLSTSSPIGGSSQGGETSKSPRRVASKEDTPVGKR